jgi:hypothetical protein
VPQDDTYLFARIPGSRHDLRSHATGAKSTQQTNDNLAAFTDWVNAFCQQHGRPDGIPLVNGQRWRLSTSQFRRTLAWFIARQPGGVIAGSMAYRHHRVQMFEGYAGTSASGFRAEVEAEDAIAFGGGPFLLLSRRGVGVLLDHAMRLRGGQPFSGLSRTGRCCSRRSLCCATHRSSKTAGYAASSSGSFSPGISSRRSRGGQAGWRRPWPASRSAS